jgi:hypothetical protein
MVYLYGNITQAIYYHKSGRAHIYGGRCLANLTRSSGKGIFRRWSSLLSKLIHKKRATRCASRGYEQRARRAQDTERGIHLGEHFHQPAFLRRYTTVAWLLRPTRIGRRDVDE